MILTIDQIETFRETIYEYYRAHGRSLPWRMTDNPYHVLVSEVMLQQTQVERVLQKYDPFLRAFPDFLSLADADVTDVLFQWQGLGYNRRALFLQRAAKEVVARYGGNLPAHIEQLEELPGIGRPTAGAIAAFAFNLPAVFIETNIRRVFIHFFFHDSEAVRDSEILSLVKQTLDTAHPGTWYHALMDYGSMLKGQTENPNRRSLHYRKQPPFEDSNRKIRGEVLRTLLEKPNLPEGEIGNLTNQPTTRIRGVLAQLEKEGFVREEEGLYRIR